MRGAGLIYDAEPFQPAQPALDGGDRSEALQTQQLERQRPVLCLTGADCLDHIEILQRLDEGQMTPSKTAQNQQTGKSFHKFYRFPHCPLVKTHGEEDLCANCHAIPGVTRRAALRNSSNTLISTKTFHP